MAKTIPKIPQAIRDCVSEALNIQKAHSLPRRWDQAVHSIANGIAAQEAASVGEIDPLAFAETYGHHGFLGNCSQFAQVLDALEDKDDLRVKRETTRSALASYLAKAEPK